MADENSSTDHADQQNGSAGLVKALAAVLLTAMGGLLLAGATFLVAKVIPLSLQVVRREFAGSLAKPELWADGSTGAVIFVFAATYLVMAIGKLPGYQLDRAGAALLGASLMVALGAISLTQAYHAIDFDTITLLLGMMIVVGNLRLSGFFGLVNNWVVTRAHYPIGTAAGDRRGGGGFLRISGQRHDMSGHGSAGS